jgi:HlyD family secretion protein
MWPSRLVVAVTIPEPLTQDTAVSPPPAWRRVAVFLAVAVPLVGLVVGGAALAQRWMAAPSSVSASRLSIATVERGTLIRDVAAEGTVVAAAAPTLYSSQAGSVTFKVRAGDEVQRAQVLAVISSPELEARLAQERSAEADKKIDVQRSEVEMQRGRAQAENEIATARIIAQTADNNAKRQADALQAGATAAAQVEHARDELAKARIALAHAETNLALQDSRAKFELESRRLTLARQQLVVRDLERQREELSVRSPVAGRVGQILVAERASVARDAALLTVIDLTALEVQMKVPETQARELSLDLPGEITANNRTWPAKVARISPEVVAREVAAQLRFEGAMPAELRQNQRLSVRVLLDRRDNVLLLPRGSFVDEGGGAYAYVVERDGVAAKRRIRVGAKAVDKVEILDGLAVGDQVVISGAAAFNDAPRVAISR